MRNNQPVTQREYVLKDEAVLISRSDSWIHRITAALWIIR